MGSIKPNASELQVLFLPYFVLGEDGGKGHKEAGSNCTIFARSEMTSLINLFIRVDWTKFRGVNSLRDENKLDGFEH